MKVFVAVYTTRKPASQAKRDSRRRGGRGLRKVVSLRVMDGEGLDLIPPGRGEEHFREALDLRGMSVTHSPKAGLFLLNHGIKGKARSKNAAIEGDWQKERHGRNGAQPW